MTQAALAESTGVTEQTIRKIEHGEGNLQLDVLSALIEVLQMDRQSVLRSVLCDSFNAFLC